MTFIFKIKKLLLSYESEIPGKLYQISVNHLKSYDINIHCTFFGVATLYIEIIKEL